MRSISGLTVALILLFHSTAPARSVPHRRSKRYVLNARRWDRCALRWAFRDPFRLFATRRDFHVAKNVVTAAVRAWEAEAGGNLRLVDVSSAFEVVPATASATRPAHVDIDMLFAYGAHGDAETFDGAGGMVAHTAYPVHGLVHFDADERWTVGGGPVGGNADTSDGQHLPTSVDLRYVALHELGHALGLRHSSHHKSIMNPYYSENASGPPQLSRDDAQGLRELFAHCIQPNDAARISDGTLPKQLSSLLL